MTTQKNAAAGSATGHTVQSFRFRRPVIAMTPDLVEMPETPTENTYAVRTNYAEAIAEAGGIPVILPYDAESISAILAMADGIVLTGTQPGTEASEARRRFERRLVEEALKARKPLLGICHGMQLIGEFLGGEFVTELPEPGVAHLPSDIPDELAHEIRIEPSSWLDRWAKKSGQKVNSLHRHALTGRGHFRVVAQAADGVIEAFEGETDAFCLGVQWHPEYRLTQLDREILKAFVAESAKARAEARNQDIREGNWFHSRLAMLGLALPEAVTPPGAFSGAVRRGETVTVSGQVPLVGGAVAMTGQLGADISVDDGRECARICLLNALAQLERTAGGDLDRLQGFVRLAGYVAATGDFTRHGAVIDGASELLRDLFPDRWEHARIAIGVSSLPRGVPVEIELTACLRSEV